MMILGVSFLGLTLSLVVVSLLLPPIALPWRWARQGLGMHIGLWVVLYGTLLLLLWRPWFAMALSVAFVMLIVQVSNAKYSALREPFVFQDFEYFIDAIKHPRLYIPYLGWGNFSVIALVVIGALWIGLALEPTPEGGRALTDLLWETLTLICFGGAIIWLNRKMVSVAFDPVSDLSRWGLLGTLWIYGVSEQHALEIPKERWQKYMASTDAERPDFVVVQSESFFDARQLYAGIRTNVLAAFDKYRANSYQFGSLTVPAFGANTVRSEFAFLSGQPEVALGVHRFNPYRGFAKGQQIETLVSVLKAKGYYTACIHPYPASFYTRDKVFPAIGFDEFIDITSFNAALRFGPYVADSEVADRVLEMLKKRTGQPCFIFVITMENHGPLHLEKPQPDDLPAFYNQTPPVGLEDLTVYLRHLKNADDMISHLCNGLHNVPRPVWMCWYGDHVPILDSVYRTLGVPSGETEYFIWFNQIRGSTHIPAESRPLSIDRLADALFKLCGW